MTKKRAEFSLSDHFSTTSGQGTIRKRRSPIFDPDRKWPQQNAIGFVRFAATERIGQRFVLTAHGFNNT
jgi:hypothetical protein